MDHACIERNTTYFTFEKHMLFKVCSESFIMLRERRQTKRYFWGICRSYAQRKTEMKSEREREKEDDWKRHWERWIHWKNECHSHTRCHIYLPALRSTCCCCCRRLCARQNIWLRWMQTLHAVLFISNICAGGSDSHLSYSFSHSLPLAHYFLGKYHSKTKHWMEKTVSTNF